MAYATLGDFKFRLDPDAISYDYKVDYSVINTIGGQVVQVLGATTSDITISGSFGQDHKNKLDSWQLAEQFHTKIRQLMDAQVLNKQGTGGATHQPIKFSYMDGVHNWDFKVLIKGISDPDGGGSIDHRTGKFAYRYQLTLFLVEDRTLNLKKVATDEFIARIATNGLGWKNYAYGKSGSFEGSDTINEAIAFVQNHSDDGTFDDYVVKLLEGSTASATPTYKTATDDTSDQASRGGRQ